MFVANNDLGAELYKTWTEAQRVDEINKLVQGYRSGVPVGILCKMTEAIAGDKKRARKILKQLLTIEERKAAMKSAEGGLKPLVKSFME